jgi:O-antigen/teichoic acid export membrane protein
MVGGLMGVTAVGLFGFAKRISLIVTDLSAGALSAVTYSLLVSLQQEKEKLREAVLLATYASSLISFPLFVGLALVSPDAIPLIFGSHWLAAVPILQVVCALGLLAAIGIIQASVIKSQGRADWWMWYQAIQQLLTVLVVLMFYGYGLKSVALAIVVKTWIVWPATLVMTSHLVKLPMLSYLRQFSTPILGCISMAVSLHLLRLGFRIEADLLRLTAEILLGAAVYALTLWSLARKRLLLLFAHLLAAKAGRNHQRNAL